MADNTSISWTDSTWNPIVGCSIVSPGCTNCYAMKMADRIGGMIIGHMGRHGGDPGPMFHYEGTTTRGEFGNKPPVWTGKVALAPDSILTQPLRWRRPRKIFVNSMGDLFHESVPDEMIDRVFAVMALAPQHTFQCLTKRSARMRDYFTTCPMALRRAAVIDRMHEAMRATRVTKFTAIPWPLPNVWLGISAEDQRRADERVPDLLATPAAVRFVSAEPLIGPIDLRPWLSDDDGCEQCDDGAGMAPNRCSRPDIPREEQCPRNLAVFDYVEHGPIDEHGCPAAISEERRKLDWTIVGGESGPGARPMHPSWARDIRDQCAVAGVAFHFKQWGAWKDGSDFAPDAVAVLTDGTQVAPTPEAMAALDRDAPVMVRNPTMMRLVGKSRAGRLLDGRTHDAFPGAAR